MNTIISTNESSLEVIEKYISNPDDWYEYLLSLPLIKYPKGKLFGKEITFHRSIGFFSDYSEGYRFSGQIIKTGGLSSILKKILNDVNTQFSKEYNGILVNVYYTGEDYISAHSDDEKDLKSSEVVAISFGQSRTFRIRPKDKTLEIDSKISASKKHKTPVYDIPTTHGQLLYMKGEFQKEFTHEIPIEKTKNNIRVSLTFRYHSK